jgi:hypothetical protein
MWSSYPRLASRRRTAALGAALLVAVLAGAALLVWPKPFDHSRSGPQPLARAAAITCRVATGETLRCVPAASDAERPIYRLFQRMSNVTVGTNVAWFPATGTSSGAHLAAIPLTWPAAVACPDRPGATAWRCVAATGPGTLAPARDVALYVEQP